MPWGVVANVVATGLASASYGAAAWAAQQRQRDLGKSTGPAACFFGLIALFLLLAAARQVAAAAGSVEADLGIYLFNVPIAALVIVPHAYLVTLVRTGSPSRAAQVGLVFVAVVAVGSLFALLGGVTAEPRTDYGTDWALQSVVARILIIVAILLPGLVGSGWLVVLSRRLKEPERRRIRLVGLASLGYFLLFTLDAYGLSGPILLVDRILTAVTGLVAFWAYRDIRKPMHTYTPPREDPGQNPFGR